MSARDSIPSAYICFFSRGEDLKIIIPAKDETHRRGRNFTSNPCNRLCQPCNTTGFRPRNLNAVRTTSSGLAHKNSGGFASIPAFDMNSVRVSPGQMAKTSTPLGYSSTHNDSARLNPNDFVAVYAAAQGPPCSAATLETIITAPWARSIIPGTNIRVSSLTASAFRVII